MDKKLQGKVVVVTGGHQGLGRIFAETCAGAGAEVWIASRNVQAMEQAASAIGDKTGATCRFAELNVTQEESVARVCQHIFDISGKVDVLINNAALGRGSTPLEDASLEEWNAIMDTNVTGTFLCMKHFGKRMIGQGHGNIINLGSLAAKIAMQGVRKGAYDTSKAAIECLTRCAAAEWAQYNIRVNAIAPGLFLTDINRRFIEENPGFYEASAVNIPMHRWGEPHELGAVALFLASSDSSYVTGSVYPVDGGYPIW